MNQDEHSFQAFDYPVEKILSCISGNQGLTEEAIYQNILGKGQRYKVLSGSTIEETKMGEIPLCNLNEKPLQVFEDREGILVIRNGKAGSTFYLNKGKYTITDHAYILILNNNCPYEVSLRWFMYKYRWLFYQYISSSDNGTWNMTGFFKNAKVDIPSFEQQQKFVALYEKIEGLNQKCLSLRLRLTVLLNRQHQYPYKKFQARNVPILRIIDFMAGNSGLTEEYVYSQIQEISEKRYRILTGSIDYDKRKFIHRCVSPTNHKELISVIEGHPIIHIVRKGKAGASKYLEAGDYTCNDDAYLLFLKNSNENTIIDGKSSYDINLKWLFYEERQKFFEYATASDNGTWNKTNFLKEMKIDVPSYEEQIKMIAFYENIEQMKTKIESVSNHIGNILKKIVA